MTPIHSRLVRAYLRAASAELSIEREHERFRLDRVQKANALNGAQRSEAHRVTLAGNPYVTTIKIKTTMVVMDLQPEMTHHGKEHA